VSKVWGYKGLEGLAPLGVPNKKIFLSLLFAGSEKNVSHKNESGVYF
jgi:hypothetical protein